MEKSKRKAKQQKLDDTEPMELEEEESQVKPTNERHRGQTQDNLPWVEKYRPSDLTQLISHNQIVDTIQKLMDGDKLPHLLFYGPPGTGKTSTILAVARKMYPKSYNSMILELNASDDRGIETVRDKIKEFANTRNIFGPSKLKLVILDEADAMTAAAQAALRRVIEKYTKTTRFCLICNYLNKIIPALQSRCTRFRFAPLKDEDVTDRLQHIAQAEGVNITPKGLEAVIYLGQGDMRKCLNVLQSAFMAYSNKQIDVEEVYSCTGNPLPEEISLMLNYLLNESFKTCFDNISALQTLKGLALQDIISELHIFVLKLDIGPRERIYLLDKLAQIEYRLSTGCSEKINLADLIGIFQLARNQAMQESEESTESTL